jgi:hypothetical protein
LGSLIVIPKAIQGSRATPLIAYLGGGTLEPAGGFDLAGLGAVDR